MSIVRTAYAFTPTSITGCALWLDGTDPAGNGVIPSAGTLSTWTDKSGSGNNAIAYTGATAPSYSPTTSNVTFGTNYYYIAGISSAPANETVFMVLRRTSSFTNTPYGTSIGGGATWYMDNTNPSFIAWNPFGNPNSSGANLLFYNNVTNVVCGTNSGGTNVMYLNGTGDTAGSTSFTSGGIMTIGTSSSGVNGSPTQNGFIGTISEVIFYNSVLGTTQRQQVEGYLAQKWGATSSLVAGHPGRTSRIYRSDYLVPNKVIPTPYYTQFSPRQIPGCSLWLDGVDPAGNGVIPADGATVSTWVDKSGNSKNGSQVNNPTYDLARKAIYFSGSSQYYTLPDSTFPIGNTSYSYFIIANFTSLGTGSGTSVWAGVLGGGGFTPSTSIAFRTNGAGGGFYEYWYANDIFSSTTYATNQIVAIESFYTSGGQRSLIQNFSVTTTNTPSTPRNQSAGNNVIGRTFSNEYMMGYIYEVIVYNSALGTTQRQQVESYLAQKWGLTASLPGGHSHLTKQAGAVTTVALSKFKVTGLPRITFASTGLVITHQDGRTWKATANNPGYANYAIGLNSGSSMSLNIYAGADVFNSAGGRVALLYNGDTNNAVRHAGYVMWTSTFAANNYDFGWKFVSSGSGYLIYNDYPSIGSAWQVTYDSGQDRVLIQPPGAGTYGMVWNITPRVTLAYVYSSY